MQYINDLGTFDSIDYSVLGRYLQNIDHLDDRTYWSLYLLERSIPRREGDTKS